MDSPRENCLQVGLTNVGPLRESGQNGRPRRSALHSKAERQRLIEDQDPLLGLLGRRLSLATGQPSK